MGKRRDRRQHSSSRRVKLDLSMDDVLLPSGTPGSLNDLDSTLGEEVKSSSQNQETVNENPLSLLGQYSDDEADADDFGTESLYDADSEANKETLKYEDEQNQVLGDSGSEEKENRITIATGSNQQISKEVFLSETGVQDLTPKNEWQPVLDEHSGEYYYWNVRNGETTWVNPLAKTSADEPAECFGVQPVDGESLQGENVQESSKAEMNTEDDHGEPNDGERRSPPDNSNTQHPDKAISCLDSTDIELNKSNPGLVSGKNDLVDAIPAAEEKIQDGEDPESMAVFYDYPQDNGVMEEVKKKDEEESVPNVVDHEKGVDFENGRNMEGTSERNSPEIKAGTSSRGSPDLMKRTQPIEEVHDALMCTRNSLPIEELRTIQEEMASFVEKLESLDHRLSTLASHENMVSFTETSTHALVLSQTKARLNDWKVFCALEFAPEACLSFMQKEFMQFEQDVTAEEAKTSNKQKLIDPTSTSEGYHDVRSELRESDQPFNWDYSQHAHSVGVMQSVHGERTDNTGKVDDVEEGEIQTSYGEKYPADGAMPEGTIGTSAQKFSNGAGNEDVDMDVDMDLDEEFEAEPAVPGSDVSVSEEAAYSYLYPHPGSMAMSTVTHLDSFAGQPTVYFDTGIPGYSWAPPLPPDDEWAPPPPGYSEQAPPPPPDEPQHLNPQLPEVAETSSLPSTLSEPQLQYYLPEYSLDTISVSHNTAVTADYQSIVDPSVYGTYGDGVVYSNSAQSMETLIVDHPYVVASDPSLAFNGWTLPVIAPTASSLLLNPTSSEAPVKSASYASSMAADNNTVGVSLEMKKPIKGKQKKRTHAVAAAPMLNKKVSSLVNKWKQAKEELHGGEEEDDDKALYDFELLERKRQKEIEEWRRQQIASGEALDNANFQPLGTSDWRERVKRARKSESKEVKEETAGLLACSEVGGKDVETMKSKKPNLMDLSKGLPAGWQAFWDETSGEVYYGNLSTQETTWDRPDT